MNWLFGIWVLLFLAGVTAGCGSSHGGRDATTNQRFQFMGGLINFMGSESSDNRDSAHMQNGEIQADAYVRSDGEREVPVVDLLNSGATNAELQVVVRQILDGKEHSQVSENITLIANTRRGVAVTESQLPMSDIKAGKTGLIITAILSPPPVDGVRRSMQQYAWEYDQRHKSFRALVLVPRCQKGKVALPDLHTFQAFEGDWFYPYLGCLR